MPNSKHALVLQCGGPTAVVNRSLAALVRRWWSLASGRTLYGGPYGLAALREGDWVPLTAARALWIAEIDGTPGMALGGGRVRLTEADAIAAVRRLGERQVGTLFLIGGNGTMAAGRLLAAQAAAAGVPLQVVCVPKTIDNDIPGTDVCPGFPSAARFLIDAVRDVSRDVSSMRGYEDVVLIETMGRHAGWLAAATWLARDAPADGPHLVLVPEVAVEPGAFVDAVREQHARGGICVVSVAEGVRDGTGRFLAELGRAGVERDPADQVILGRSGGPLPALARLVREKLGLRCRLVRPDVLQRCARSHVSDLDRTLAALAGTAAVEFAAGLPDGVNPRVMIALRQTSDGWTTDAVPLGEVTGERLLPHPESFDPTSLLPLLG